MSAFQRRLNINFTFFFVVLKYRLGSLRESLGVFFIYFQRYEICSSSSRSGVSGLAGGWIGVPVVTRCFVEYVKGGFYPGRVRFAGFVIICPCPFPQTIRTKPFFLLKTNM